MRASLGEELRAARAARGLSLSDVAAHIHIRPVYLQGIEDENWSLIGAPVYARGFIRAYARYLGVDPDLAVARFNERTGALSSPAPPPPSPRSLEPVEERGPSLSLWIALAVAAVLLGFVAFNYFELLRARPAAVRTAPAATHRAAIHRATAAPAPRKVLANKGNAPDTLVLRFLAPSWVRVAVDGAVSMQGTFPAGTERAFHGKRATLVVGNAGGVALNVNGHDLGKLGASGAVVERSITLAQE